MVAHASTQYLHVAVTTCLTAVHISQGGEPCIAVLVHGSHALYVGAAQGQTRRGELKLHHRAHLSLFCLAVVQHSIISLPYICNLFPCFPIVFTKAADWEIHSGIVVKLLHLKQTAKTDTGNAVHMFNKSNKCNTYTKSSTLLMKIIMLKHVIAVNNNVLHHYFAFSIASGQSQKPSN